MLLRQLGVRWTQRLPRLRLHLLQLVGTQAAL
jgi:hypothetical protein